MSSSSLFASLGSVLSTLRQVEALSLTFSSLAISSYRFSATPASYIFFLDALGAKMSTITKKCSFAETQTHGDAVIERAERRGLTKDRLNISVTRQKSAYMIGPCTRLEARLITHQYRMPSQSYPTACISPLSFSWRPDSYSIRRPLCPVFPVF